MTTSNPINSRLERLHEQWLSFANEPEARILVWQARADEATMVEAWVAKESDEHSAETADVFLRLRAPFTHVAAHGYALREELITQYDQVRDELRSEGVEAVWQCPFADAGDDDLGALLRALASLHEHHALEGSILCVWLDAADMTLDQERLLWLQRLAQQAPAHLRFIIVDGATDAAVAPLLRAEPTRVLAQACGLDMPGALSEVAEASHDRAPGPDTQFRLLMVKLAAAAGEGDLTAALPFAEAALRLARIHGWPQLAAAVQMMLGGAYGAAGQPLDAAKSYTEADRLAEESEQQAGGDEQEPPEGDAALLTQARQLRLQARFGQGATLISCSAWKQAAEVYLSAAPLAASLADLRAELDCYRLASVCFSQHGELEKAWSVGLRGVQHAQTLDQPALDTSTAPYLGDHLLRFADTHASYRPLGAALEKQLATMLGPDWRAKLASGATG